MKASTLHIYARKARFCRWSHRSWAVFASLGAVVSIGFLSVSVAEKSLLKSSIGHISANLTEKSIVNEHEAELSEVEIFDNSAIEIILTHQKTETVAVCGSLNNILKQMPVARNFSFDRHFYFQNFICKKK